jgi:O-antigen/teichoic acid export membrane protein
MATGINGEIILYSRHIKFNLLTNVLLIVVSTTTTYILIPEWGVIGAAVSIPVSYLAYNSIRMLFLSLVYKIHPFTTKTLLAVLWISIWGLIVFIIPTDYKSIWISILFSLLVSVIYIYAILQFSISAEINALWNKYKHLIRL